MTATLRPPEAKPAPSCAHCGDPCRTETVRADGHAFCCQGCATVYQVLAAHQLGDFYRLDPAAGRSQRRQPEADYAWLDVDKLSERVLRYRDAERCHVEIELPAIHCASCVWLLEQLPRLLPGVRAVTVDLPRRSAVVVYDPRRTHLRTVAEWLARIGYPPHFQRHGAERQRPADRGLLYRIGVAGFCFGNMMLLSFPEYLGLSAEAGLLPDNAFSALLERGIGYLLLALSLPVLLYSGRGFFTAAWYGLRLGRVSIDVPIVLGMVALFLRSAYEILSGTGAGYLDSLAGLVFFLLIGRWFQAYTFQRLDFTRDYRDYFPVAARRVTASGDTEPVAVEDLAVDDTLVVRPGQLVPADGELLADAAGGIDYSFVTGEADPRPARRGDEVFAGGRALGTALRLRVRKTVAESYLLQLWRDADGAPDETGVAPPERLILGFTLTLLILAAGTLAYWYGTDPGLAYRAATAVLIIACPCALALAAPFAYGSLQRLLGQRGCYLKHPGVIRRLAATDTFIFDKTGTLVAGDGIAPLTRLATATAEDERILLAMAEQSLHPRSRALARSLRANGVRPATIPEVSERTGSGLHLRHDAGDYRLGQPGFCGCAEGAGVTCASKDGVPLLTLEAATPDLRPGGAEMLRAMQAYGPTFLLSGDSPPATSFWEDFLPADRLHFRCTPFAKEERVKALQATGRRVLMVGDGLNDAGALRRADVGLAVSEEEARFSPACDGIISGESLRELPRFHRLARELRRVLAVTYGVALLYNLVGLGYAVTGALSPVVAAVLMPLSSVTIVLLASAGAWWVARK